MCIRAPSRAEVDEEIKCWEKLRVEQERLCTLNEHCVSYISNPEEENKSDF